VTVAHESQHLKFAALLDGVDLTMPGDGQRCYAPWREDPRPVVGLLQSAYAFLGRQRVRSPDSARISSRPVKFLFRCGTLAPDQGPSGILAMSLVRA